MPLERRKTIRALLVLLAIGGVNAWTAAQDEQRDGYIDNHGVRLHYVTQGSGPLVVMIHGFPDFWYTWRDQMRALAPYFQVVAYDQRGYNLSSQPEGVNHYAMSQLVADLLAVVDHFDADQATIVGHDWGGAVAWTFAMQHPDRTKRLVILNLPHPRGLMRELATNAEQRSNSQYARDFQQPDAASKLTAAGLASWVSEENARKKYVEAFQRSSFDGMLNYYKANYPRVSVGDETADVSTLAAPMPNIRCPVLLFHGLDDRALLPAGLNNTWEWIDADLTMVTIPGAGHFVHRDAAPLVTRRMLAWLRE